MDVLDVSHRVDAGVQSGGALHRRQSVHARVVAHVSAVSHHHGGVRVARQKHRLRRQRRASQVPVRRRRRGRRRRAVQIRPGQVLYSCNAHRTAHLPVYCISRVATLGKNKTRDLNMTQQIAGWKNNRSGGRKGAGHDAFLLPILLFFQPVIWSVIFRSRVVRRLIFTTAAQRSTASSSLSSIKR